MTRPWQTLDRVDTAEGPLELRRRGADELLITIDGRILMNGVANRSELALARLGCAALPPATAPRVLVGGLGLGFTLRAALDALPASARVTVAELTPAVVDWCRGPARSPSGDALADPRVDVQVADVADVIAEAARARGPARFHAILLDLYEGPHEATQSAQDPFYGAAALRRTRQALHPGGVLAVWSEEPDAAFARRLSAAGFHFELHRPGKGGRRHAVYVARSK